MPQLSVIIPVLNGWELTRPCLKSLAGTTQGQDIEVIVVDNCSSDVTARAAPVLGKQLFGDNFKYLRNEQNRNFGPANNQAALLARGEYLVLLNNDTELLPGWHGELLADFQAYPDIAATGPLLMFPAQEPFGHTVQHLGVFINPFWRAGHLYDGISATSPLAQKRRFFQAITAACMMMPRETFLDAGMFDEAFVNGFEDVELCARLSAKGKRFTVNPNARVIHHESMAQGRNRQENNNSSLYFEKAMPLLKTDMETHFHNDDLQLKLTPWHTLRPALASAFAEELDADSDNLDCVGVQKRLNAHPYWEKGWRQLLEFPEMAPFAFELRRNIAHILQSPLYYMEVALLALRAGNTREASYWLDAFEPYCLPFAVYKEMIDKNKIWFDKTGQGNMLRQAETLEQNLDAFNRDMLTPLTDAAALLRRRLGKPAN